MRGRWFAFEVGAALAPVALVAAVSAAGPAAAAPAARPGQELSITAQLTGVAAVSATNVWVVGYTGGATNPKILIEHHTGGRWKRVSVPGVVNGVLNAVAATSASSVWAVGSSGNFESGTTLVLHWDGKAWASVPSPSPAASNSSELLAVTARSASTTWAVGVSNSSSGSHPLTLHWTGTAWTQVRSPALKGADLVGVAAARRGSGWAVGERGAAGAFAERWNGSRWATTRSPDSRTADFVTSVAGNAAGRALAVGFRTAPSVGPLSMRWHRGAWKQVRIRDARLGSLESVTVLPNGSAWAVGGTIVGQGGSKPLILRWNGTAWRRARTPRGAGTLFAVSATSRTNAWAVGDTDSGKTLILHWNGKAWT